MHGSPAPDPPQDAVPAGEPVALHAAGACPFERSAPMRLGIVVASSLPFAESAGTMRE